MRACLVWVAPVCLAACFNPSDNPSDTDGNSQTGDSSQGPGGNPGSGLSSGSNPSTTDQPTSMGPGSADTTMGSDSTGEPTTGPAPMCGDGQPAEGELCFDDLPDLHTVGNGPYDVAIGDLDGDTALDIATLNREIATVTILPGDGVGGFGTPSSETVADAGTRIHAVDGDLDGDVDLVVGGEEITVLQNDGGGNLSPVISALGFSFYDTHNELLVVQADSGARLDILFSEAYGYEFLPADPAGDYTFGASVGMPAPGEGSSGIAAVNFEFDGDNFIDVILLNQYSDEAWILRGNGDGTFTPHVTLTELCTAGAGFDGGRHVLAGDVDGDNDVDFFATCMQGDTNLVLGNGDGSFGAPTSLATDGAHRPYLEDLDMDGDLDLLLPSTTLDHVELWTNDGTGAFTQETTFAVGGPAFTAGVEDINGDGALDVVTAFADAAGGHVAVWLADP